MVLTEKISKNNVRSYIWHAVFLALAQNFMDVDTIIPSMLIDAGGTSFHIGLLTAIMVGGSSFSQIFFTPVLSNKSRKKGYLLFGINLRVAVLFGLGFLLFWYNSQVDQSAIVWVIFILISLFSISGAFAAISYSDILGRSVLKESRKSFFSLRQALSSIGILLSAYFAGKVLTGFDYPTNYSWLFLIAGSGLLIASFGFWNIKEIPGSKLQISGVRDYLNVIRTEIKNNKRLRNYLLLVNTLGVSVSVLPFIVLYGKEYFGITTGDISFFLLLKVIAGVIFGTLLFFYSKKVKYSMLLYAITLLALFAPITIWLFDSESLFGVYFFIGGVIYTLYKVAIEGILLEVSDNQNRTVYIGIMGVGNLLPALFPVFGGWLIPRLGFGAFFGVFSLIILVSVFVIGKLDCKK